MAQMMKASTTNKILKTLGMFGSVQAVGILCSVVRTKLAALWIGPLGVGLMTIYNSTMDLLAQTSQLNISQSSVRDLSLNRDGASGPLTVAVTRRLSLFLGLVGLVAVVLFSPLISLWAFGDTSHAWAFAALSLMMLTIALTNAEFSVMRAYDHLGALAKTSLYTALTSIVIAVPLLYFLRLKAIVPILLVYFGTNCIYALIFRAKDIPHVTVSLKEAWRQGGSMVRLGVYMTVSTAVTLLASNLFVVYLNRVYGQDTVGIYQAGYTLINTYVGIIFNAIAMEYYPRLSLVGGHKARTETVVSHEIKVTLWVLLPVAIAFVCCSGLAVRLLYSAQFAEAVPYVAVGATGVFFRAASWCLAYTILARGDGRTYIITELVSALVYLALHIPVFNAFGFKGLGVAYLLWYAVYFAVVYAVYRRHYRLRLRRGIIPLLATAIGIALLTLILNTVISTWLTLALLLPPAIYAAYRHLF